MRVSREDIVRLLNHQAWQDEIAPSAASHALGQSLTRVGHLSIQYSAILDTVATNSAIGRYRFDRLQWISDMRSILLYFLGIPIPIILLLALCTHHF
jgi:hypothetical protein